MIQVGKIQTVDELLSRYLRYPRSRAVLASALALIAMVLAIVGLYGLLSQLVTQRIREIGIRVALGAQTVEVVKMVVKQGLGLASIGIGCGLALVFVLNRFIRGVLYGVTATDPFTLISASLLLMAFAFLVP